MQGFYAFCVIIVVGALCVLGLIALGMLGLIWEHYPQGLIKHWKEVRKRGKKN